MKSFTSFRREAHTEIFVLTETADPRESDLVGKEVQILTCHSRKIRFRRLGMADQLLPNDDVLSYKKDIDGFTLNTKMGAMRYRGPVTK